MAKDLGVSIWPIIRGTTRVVRAAEANKHFPPKPRLRAVPPLMMCITRFFRSAPVIPETQANDDSTQNSQTFKMLSA
jgi:hypothetical protein